MSRHGNNATQKPDDLKKSIKGLFKYLKKFTPYILIALILASCSSIFTIIGPNKLKELTNEISTGLIIDTDEFQSINTSIFSELSEKDVNDITKLINVNEQSLYSVLNDDSISFSDKENLKNMNFLAVSPDVLSIILEDNMVNDVVITKDDQISLLTILSKLSLEDVNKAKLVSELPVSVKKVLFTDSYYKDKKITVDDKIAYLDAMGSIDTNSSKGEMYGKLDLVPDSIKSFIKPRMNFDNIKSICLFLLIIYLISALFNFIQGFIMATVSNNFAKELRSKISNKLNKLPLSYFDKNSYGDILSRITNDVDTIGTSMSQSLSYLVGAITLFIGSIVMMFVTNYIMAITAIVSSLFGFIFMGIIFSKSQKYFLARQVELGKLNGHIEEVYSAHNVVKAYNGEEDALNKFNVLNESVYNCNRKSQFLSGLMMPVMNFIGNFGYVCVCVVGALLVANKSIDFGVIVAFVIYVRLFTSPLSQIAQGITNLQTTLAASERVVKFVEEPELENEDKLTSYLDPKNVKGSIEFNHVKFGYDEDKVIIKDFNCKVKPGQKVAIVGPTGAGKTTMVNLLMKFYNITSGDIVIDGKSIHDLTRENIHDLFIMVLQDTWVFNSTIRDNVRYNKENVSDDEIWKNLKTVGVDYFVKSLPNGLDYELNDSDSISGGQKQLLTIARAMTKDSPFLILDEATSSVDTRTEELVQKAMDKLTKGRTSFIIAHRLSTIKNADIIFVMKEGDIIEQGTHEELLKKNGFYKELYSSQFKN